MIWSSLNHNLNILEVTKYIPNIQTKLKPTGFVWID